MMLGHNITELHNSRSHRDIKIRSHRDTKKYMSWAEQGHTQMFFYFSFENGLLYYRVSIIKDPTYNFSKKSHYNAKIYIFYYNLLLAEKRHGVTFAYKDTQ